MRRLRELARSASRRRQEQVYIAEGVRWAEEALEHGAEIDTALVSALLARSGRGKKVREGLARLDCARFEVPDEVLSSTGDVRTPQGVLLVLKRPDDSLGVQIERAGGAAREGIWVVAVGIQDPGNLGSLLRTARALGAAGLVAFGGADLFHPRAVRASAGALLDLPAAQGRDEQEVLSFLRSRQAWAATARGGRQPRAVRWSGRQALVLGSEGAGLPPAIEAACAGRVSVPMRSGSESLNVTAAAAALLALIGSPDPS